MDYIFTKAFLIEFVITGFSLYKFPYSTLITSGLIFGTYYMIERSKLQSKNINKVYMNAALYNSNGDFKFGKIPVPKISKDELLVQVKAAALNPVDYKVRTNSIPFLRWFVQPTVGRDFSGVVVDIGEKITKFKIGDEIYGNAKGGSLQEYTFVKEGQVGIKASNISFAEAASVGLAGGTSLQALKYWGDLNNKKVLIIGASGGCGNLGVQIAKYYNAKVFAICSAKNAEFVSKLGADVIYDYTNPNYLEQIGKEEFDLIYDTVTSPEDPNQEVVFRKFLKPEGKYVAINAVGGDWFRRFILFTGLNIERPNYHLTLLNWNTEDLNEMRKMMEENKLRSKCDVFEFNESNVNSAFEKLKSRRTVGKLVLEI
jgi:NADPH:quinone reductase-like Zn-dependent oxidoreductase